MQMVYIKPLRLLTYAEVAAYCKDIASIIRKKVPEKPDGWAAAILVERIFGDPMGVYFLGWADQPDQGKFAEPPTDHAEWQALHRQLAQLLAGHDVDRLEERSFSVFDEDNGQAKQRLSIRRIEFLTPLVVQDVQRLLRDAYPQWCVEVSLTLPHSERTSFEGIDIWADEVVEHWDRKQLKRKFGERFKF